MRHVLLTLLACCLYMAGYGQTCAGMNAAFTTAISGGTVTFTNTTTLPTSSSPSVGVNYYWSFGDGGYYYTNSNATVSHTYPVAGTYQVFLDVHWYDSLAQTQCNDSIWALVTVTAGSLNCASNNAAFTSSVSGSTATFTNTSSGAAPTGYNTSYLWLFGDGTVSSATNTSHTYTTGGTYTVKLVRRWVLGNYFYCSDTATSTVTVAGYNCANSVAGFTSTTNALTANFTNTSSAAPSGMYKTYNWYFGDGGTSASQNPSRTYSAPGTYTVKLVTNWRNSSTNNIVCTDSVMHTVAVSLNVNCANLNAAFTHQVSQTNYTVYFSNQSTFQSGLTKSYLWSFGDNTSSTLASPSHTYAAPGSYAVVLYTTWSAGGQVVCSDSAVQVVTISSLANRISGYVYSDSTTMDSSSIFKVYLINYDSTTNWLTAVDSTYTVTGLNAFYYEFNNKPAGQYRVKAQHMNGPTSGTGYVPTYHYSALTWNLATAFYHSGTVTPYKDINMQTGTITSGPGFIGGNVSQGANKGTSAGIEGMTVLLLDEASMQLVAAATTDANGNFSFSNVPTGNYLLHPEEMNYNTVPATVVITDGAPSVADLNFERSHTNREIALVSTSVGIVNKAATAFVMFPNPANGTVNLQWTNDAKAQYLVVSDVTGKKVYEQDLTNAGGKATLQLSNLQNGIYLVTFKTAAVHGIQKLVIQK